MKTQTAERMFLIGPMGSGKTTAGERVAALLGWRFFDTDAMVERDAGMPVAQVFAREGEEGFRERESAALAQIAREPRAVVATGGGIGERAANLALMRAQGWLVELRARPATSLRRLSSEGEAREPGAVRPLLASADPLGRLSALFEQRRGWYAQADDAIGTDELTSDEVAARVVAGLVARGLLPPDGAEPAERVVRAGAGGYTAVTQWGALATLAERLRALDAPPRVHLVADANVARLYEQALMPQLQRAGFEPLLYRVPAGEASKSREQLNALYDWLAERRAERREVVVALGGGVVGDLAGFAAATYLRGVPLIQVPTSLLAQVDASIGGKVAIDHPLGKNLIGAFYPPRLVLADPAALLTLPPRQRIEGWAEVVKHGVALDAAYFAALERDVEALLRLEPAVTTRAIAGSVALKASVVEGDEREGEGGRRALLNYGHTIGHAIETVTGYGAWLHGEAVAVGMMAAARLGQRLGVTPDEVVTRQAALLARFGLPTRADGLPAADLLRAALWDKKARGGKLRWVLPTALGVSALVGDVAESETREALYAIGAV